jgi:hypothetical protein
MYGLFRPPLDPLMRTTSSVIDATITTTQLGAAA